MQGAVHRPRTILTNLVMATALVSSQACGGGSDGGETVAPKVVISEVVVVPLDDWSDREGTPYDMQPGDGLVNSADEYVELYNAGSEAVNLRGWTLELRDRSSATTTLSDDNDAVVLSPDSTLDSFAPGAFAVVGDPAGLASTDVFIVLRDAEGTIIDDVEIGGLHESRDMEGDGPGDGAPDPESNGFPKGSYEEAVARLWIASEPMDTDDDASDFVKMRATPGQANRLPETPQETDPPQVVSHTISNSLAVSSAVTIDFDEPIHHASVPDNIDVSIAGEAVPLDFFTLDEHDTRIVINPIGRYPFDATVDIVVQGGPGGLEDLAGNPLASDLTFTVITEAAPSDPAPVVINELCVTPQQDWGDSSGGGAAAFSETPGSGEVNANDEWVELYNDMPGVSDLSDWTLVLYAGPNDFTPARSVTHMDDSGVVVRVFGNGEGIDAVNQGDRILVGNPRGSLPFNFYLELRDPNGTLVDHVEVGGNSEHNDRGGDGLGNGAPGEDLDGNASSLSEEVIARSPDATDTGNDPNDFEATSATPGTSNM